MSKKSFALLDPNAPNTNFILGAALSGGDPTKAAKMLIEAQKEESTECELAECAGCPKCDP